MLPHGLGSNPAGDMFCVPHAGAESLQHLCVTGGDEHRTDWKPGKVAVQRLLRHLESVAAEWEEWDTAE